MARSSGLNSPENATEGLAVGDREHLPQHAGELLGHLGGGLEAPPGVGVGGAPEEPVEGLLPASSGSGSSAAGTGTCLVAAELEGEHGQRPADGVQVGADDGPLVLDLRGLVADGPVDRARRRRCRRTPPRSMSLSCSSVWITLSGLKSQ